MARQSLQLELAERPKVSIVPGKTFRHVTLPVPSASELQDGELLVETLYLSLDPAMRGWLNDIRGYVKPIQIGEVMRGFALGRVIASKSSKAKEGDLVLANTGFREVARLHESAVEEPTKLPSNGVLSDLLGVLGYTGLTAYFGMTKIGQVQPGETVVVTGAAGATGSVVTQIAKLQGGRVVAIAGSDDKVRWLKEDLKADVALNYRDPDFRKKFAEATPDYINVFWDNVGGQQLDMGLARAAKDSRFVLCGAISQYNAEKREGIMNLGMAITQRVKLQGFIVFDHYKEYPEARKQLAQWLEEGKIQRQAFIVKGGLQNSEEAFEQLFKGANTVGKLLLEVKTPDSTTAERVSSQL
ncbi:NAD(P)-binding protein [Thozetella sp. PMI_491]|nr:NAD(P)-binding protein [Thozetella sp. PMI_491]